MLTSLIQMPMSSLDLTGQVKRLGDRPVGLGDFANVYKGSLDDCNMIMSLRNGRMVVLR